MFTVRGVFSVLKGSRSEALCPWYDLFGINTGQITKAKFMHMDILYGEYQFPREYLFIQVYK